MFKLVLLSLASGLSGQTADEESKQPFTYNTSSTIAISQLVNQVDTLNLQGKVGRVSYPLPVPRPQYKIPASEVRYFLQHSLLASCTAMQIQSNKCFCKEKFKTPRLFRDVLLDAHGAVAVDVSNKLVVVSYRDSVSQRNWDLNNDSRLSEYPGSSTHVTDTQGEHESASKPDSSRTPRVHRGHLRYFKAIHPPMEPFVVRHLQNPAYSGYRLHVTGYGFGASVAAISLPKWHNALQSRSLNNKIRLYSYSGPRPGNLAYAKYLETLNITMVRYTKRGDVVPLTPDQNMGYSQVGQELYDNSPLVYMNSLVSCSPNVVEDKACSLSDSFFLPYHHTIPFHKPMPIPPFC
ncbi:hypothetical protein DSO57_1035494 [Entomophthora muscae]|uniref:Uncharacterized protein n=1 Tax=Entomophthora muscae TaxID=34485 RepID=A0ACC2TA84_9FUNG|nr:hypothetical protein DSO57_1035494 [Entomophthora muscae]